MKIIWDKVTWYSKLCAVILGVGIFFTGFYFGGEFKKTNVDQEVGGNVSEEHSGVSPMGAMRVKDDSVVNVASFGCSANKSILASFKTDNSVTLTLSDERILNLPQAISASGARYANADESIVFWNKGESAFIQENGKETFSDCTVQPTNF